MASRINAAKFKKATGNEPENDDLRRVNCKKVGIIGHYYCGWCREHDLPGFLCGHFVIDGTEYINEDEVKRTN